MGFILSRELERILLKLMTSGVLVLIRLVFLPILSCLVSSIEVLHDYQGYAVCCKSYDFSRGHALGFFRTYLFIESICQLALVLYLHRFSYGKYGRGKCLYSFSSFFEYWLTAQKENPKGILFCDSATFPKTRCRKDRKRNPPLLKVILRWKLLQRLSTFMRILEPPPLWNLTTSGVRFTY